jgi:Flp pilus assembly protein TadG
MGAMDQVSLNSMSRGRRSPAGTLSLRNEAGSALVELAVMLSVVGVPLFAGTVYIATLLHYSIEVSNAAHTGAMYGMTSSTFAQATSGITTAAQSEAPDFGTNLTVTPTIFYACSTALAGTQYSTQSAANTACTGGTNHALEFVQVNTSGSVTPLGSVPGMSKRFTLTAVSIMEVEE